MKRDRKLFNLTKVLILGAVLIIGGSQLCFGVTVNPGHPRIWIDATKKAQIIADCSPGGSLRNYYLRVKDYVDNSSEGSGNAFAHQRYWISVILTAMVDGGTYVSDIQAQIQSWYNDRENLKYSDYRMASIALCYDWLFSDLNATDKTRVAEIFKTWWGYWGGGSAYIHGSWNNHTMEEIQGFVFGSLALHGDGYCDTEAAANLIKAREWLYDELIPATDLGAGSQKGTGLNGGWLEGSYYWVRGVYGLLGNVYAWASATDEDAMHDSLCIQHFSKWLLHISRNDNTLARFSDGYALTHDLKSDSGGSALLYMLSDILNDKYARYLWNQRVSPDGILSDSTSVLSRSYANLYSYYIIFNNNTSPTVIDREPKAVYFDGMEMVAIRNSFSDNDTFFLYKNNDFIAGHDHWDAGHFQIARDVGLAIGAGAYEGGDVSPNRHDTKFYRRSIAHNVITVMDPNEIWDDYYGRLSTNDGGQKWIGPANGNGHPQRYSDFFSDPSYDRGGVTAFETTDNFTYLHADISPAYSKADGSDAAITHSSKMEKYTREISHTAGKYYVIFDKVKSSNASFVKRWLLHTVNEPMVSGSNISSVNGNSKLLVKSVLPNGSAITKRGGPGYEYWTTYDGTGENPTFNTTYYGKPPNEPGAWRIEISPSSANLTDYFLNVLYPGASAISMPTIYEIPVTNMKGVIIEDTSENQIVLFNPDIAGTPVNSVSYTVNTIAASRHVLYGLQPNTLYSVDISGEGSQSVQSGSSGALMFVNASASLHTYDIAVSGTAGVYPEPPTNIAMTQTATDAILDWDLSVDESGGGGADDVVGYKVYRSSDGGTTFFFLNLTDCSGERSTVCAGADTYTDVNPGGTQYYKVVAVDADGYESSISYQPALKGVFTATPPEIAAGTFQVNAGADPTYVNSQTADIYLEASDSDGSVQSYAFEVVSEGGGEPSIPSTFHTSGLTTGAFAVLDATVTLFPTGTVDGRYTVYAWVRDNDTSVSASSQIDHIVWFDTLEPTSTIKIADDEITAGGDVKYTDGYVTFEGTTNDPDAGATGTGVKSVEIQITDNTTGSSGPWWPTTVTGGTTWSHNIAYTSFDTEHAYTVRSRATDFASNTQSTLSAVSFEFDSDGDGELDVADKDDDDDGMPDNWENPHGLNPLINDASGNLDGDAFDGVQFTNLDEFRAGTDPTNDDAPPGEASLDSPLTPPPNASLTPTLVASGSDPTHTETRWQISTKNFTDSGFLYPGDLVFDQMTTEHLYSISIPELVLEPGQDYYWRAGFYDDENGGVDWPDAVRITTDADSDDLDGDHMPDEQELNSDPDYQNVDLDGDTNPDSLQSENSPTKYKAVITTKTNNSGKRRLAGIEIDDAAYPGADYEVFSIKAIPDNGISKPDDLTLPFGLLQFKLKVPQGAEVKVKVHLSEAVSDKKWYKYNELATPKLQNFSSYATFSADMKEVELTLTDGGLWDADGTVNGWIVDPSGPGSKTEDDIYTPPPGEGGGGCFIATTAFGSPLEKHVVILKRFRDQRLIGSSWGRQFIDFYYRHSPAIADYLRDHESMRATVRWALLPVTGLSLVALYVHPFIMVAVFVLTATLIGIWIGRSRKRFKAN